jgi:hypothetical protein
MNRNQCSPSIGMGVHDAPEYASATENTVVNIVRQDDTNFILYVSRENDLDKTFVNELKQRWHSSRR